MIGLPIHNRPVNELVQKRTYPGRSHFSSTAQLWWSICTKAPTVHEL